MANISAAEVAKLRKQTGAGMMDCKKALAESNGDFDAAIEYLRKKGQKMAAKRGDREASEGATLAAISADGKKGFLIALNCETDFVAINANFVALTQKLLDLVVERNVTSKEALQEEVLDGVKISDLLAEQTGVIGERVEVATVQTIEGAKVASYIHPGNQLATLVAFNAVVDDSVCRDVAMQAAAMNPVSLDKDDCPSDVVEKEIEIAKEVLRNEGKPEAMLDKIAQGKLGKFFKDNTLLNQDFIKDSKITVKDYIQQAEKGATATGYIRFSLKA